MKTAVKEARRQSTSPVDEVLPPRSMLTLGMQHVLVVYAGIVAVPLVLGGALGLDQGEIVVLINCNLIIGGLATLLQTLGIWRFGARLPLIQGASFIALAPMVQIGTEYGLGTVFGSVIAAGALAIGLAPLFSRLLRFFPRVVIGCLITTVGLSLMPAAAGWLGGGIGSETFGQPQHLLIGLLTVAVTVVVYVAGKGLATMLSGVFNGFPLNAFSQNTGLIAMTRVRSRYVVAVGGGIMVLMGLIPKLGAVVAAVPPAVLGGAAIVMFGMTTAAGIQELARVTYDGTHNALIVAVSLSVGVLPMAMPALLDQVRGPLALVLESGIFLCAIVAVLLNAVMNRAPRTPPTQQEGTDTMSTNETPATPEAETATEADLAHLRTSIALADEARRAGRHPFASIVVASDGRVIASQGNNSMPPEGDPTQHAELRAAAEAARAVPLEELAGATLYTSAEPCVMCTGAVYWTGIGRIVYALSEQRLLTLTGDDPENPTFDLPCREVIARGQRRNEVLGPLLEDEAAASHADFWTRQSG